MSDCAATDEAVIVRVAARGEGVTASGRHMTFAAPGDLLLADGTIEPGPHHQAPPCRHFPQCGGCQLQHLDDESYGGFVVDRVAGALAAQGLSAEVLPPVLSPAGSRRRATFHAEKRGGRVVLGFSEAQGHALVGLVECHVIHPAIFAVVTPLRRLLARVMSGKRRVEVHVTLIDQGLDVAMTGIEAAGLAAAEAISAFAGDHDIARLSVDNGLGPETRWEPDPVTITLGGVPVPFPHGAFLQATADGEAALVEAVCGAVGGASTVADLFAGLGTFALALTPGTKVYAAEGARDACMALKSAAARSQRPVFAEHRDLFRRPLATSELNRFEAIVLDPPRAGAREQAEALAASTVPSVAYVSCNPSTFARDAKILCEGDYHLDWIQPVGQFRWSTHVELVARFSR